jgi:hypothetical protein
MLRKQMPTGRAGRFVATGITSRSQRPIGDHTQRRRSPRPRAPAGIHHARPQVFTIVVPRHTTPFTKSPCNALVQVEELRVDVRGGGGDGDAEHGPGRHCLHRDPWWCGRGHGPGYSRHLLIFRQTFLCRPVVSEEGIWSTRSPHLRSEIRDTGVDSCLDTPEKPEVVLAGHQRRAAPARRSTGDHRQAGAARVQIPT